jgi:hypothetical protein
VSAAAFASETDPCADAAVTFTATASGGATDAMTYTWNIAGQTYSITSDTYSLALSAVVNNTYTVRVVNANGCTSTVSNMGTVTMESVIETRTVTAILGYPPRTDVPKSLKASVCEKTTYEWRRSGTGGDITLMDSDELSYDITKDVDAINTPGTYYYRRYATLLGGTTTAPAEGTYTLRVVAPPPSPSGTTTRLNTSTDVIWTDAIRVDLPCDASYMWDRGADYGYYYQYTNCWSANYSKGCVSPWRRPSSATKDQPVIAWYNTPGWIPGGQAQSPNQIEAPLNLIYWGVGCVCSGIRADLSTWYSDCGGNILKQARCVTDYNY